MSYKPMRIADIVVDRRVVGLFRAIFPFWGLWLLRRLKQSQREAAQSASTLGETAGKVVIEAKDGAKALRRLTVWLVALTLVNTAFVIYSAARWHSVGKRHRQAKKGRKGAPFRVVVAGYPRPDVSIEPELDPIKAALLYGDEVTLLLLRASK